MLKVSKKIRNVIEREFQTSNYMIVKRVYIHSMFKVLCTDLVVFKINPKREFLIMKYMGDNSYTICGPYLSDEEVIEELKYQIENLY